MVPRVTRLHCTTFGNFPVPPPHPKPLPHLHVIAELAVLKEVDGELEVLCLPDHRPLLAVLGTQHGQGACGLELGLQPEFGTGTGIGHVNTQAPILAENDECGATKGNLR